MSLKRNDLCHASVKSRFLCYEMFCKEHDRPGATSSSRIPTTLQSVLLASNRGLEVNRPPPDHVAFKVFPRKWFFKKNRKSSSNERKNLADANRSLKVAKVHLDTILESRGYSIKRYETLKTAYYNKPTALQMASQSVHLLDLIRDGKLRQLQAILSSGVSRNPCNKHGESLIHTVCRRGDAPALRVLLDCGSSLQISDDYGRTPLHDACWAARPAFDVVRAILELDPRQIHLVDAHGATPLSYVHRQHYQEWIEFLDFIVDDIWPPLHDCMNQEERDQHRGLPTLFLNEPHSHPVPDPPAPLSLKLASMVVSGRLHPEEASFLVTGDGTIDNCDSDDDSVNGKYNDSDNGGAEDGASKADAEWASDSYNSITTFNEMEMEEILLSLNSTRSKPIAW